jgi:hypothetical protein
VACTSARPKPKKLCWKKSLRLHSSNLCELITEVHRRIQMKDREFLIWLHERLQYVHKESPLNDYMHKLRTIIRATPKDQDTPNINSYNSLKELKKALELADASSTD